MKRLTERDAYWYGEEFWTSAKEPDDDEIDENYMKLKYYEDAEEQEKLIILPCKVGETVYVLTPKKNDYIETDVKRIVVYDNDIEIVTCICVRSIKEIGKTVFFTREQAEKKINEQKEL